MDEHEARYSTKLAVPESESAVASTCRRACAPLVVGVGTPGAFWSLFYVSRNSGTWNTILGVETETIIWGTSTVAGWLLVLDSITIINLIRSGRVTRS